MEKVKKAFKKGKVMALALMITLLTVPSAFASTPDTTTALTTAAEGVKTDFAATAAGIGPIAVGIIAIFMMWKLGIKFFKNTTNQGS